MQQRRAEKQELENATSYYNSIIKSNTQHGEICWISVFPEVALCPERPISLSVVVLSQHCGVKGCDKTGKPPNITHNQLLCHCSLPLGTTTRELTAPCLSQDKPLGNKSTEAVVKYVGDETGK